LATNKVPAAKTKSAPHTAKIGAGNPNTQYGEDGFINANNKAAKPVKEVPITGEHFEFSAHLKGGHRNTYLLETPDPSYE
jgi:hypothetical protein